jgi:putative addiction module component (TIGR02574 family)
MVTIDMDAIRRLSVPDRVRLVQDIWDTLQPTASELPLTETQRSLLDSRLAEHQADPDSAVPWEVARARLEPK